MAIKASGAVCGRPIANRVRSLCNSHKVMLYKKGAVADPRRGGEWHHRYQPADEVSYLTAHKRLYKARGRARDHQCSVCGGQAAEWSYMHSDPDEIVREDRNGWVRTFSLDPAHYSPMCKPCHVEHDALHGVWKLAAARRDGKEIS